MSSGTTKVSYPSCVARLRNAPFLASVVANILSAAFSWYFFINNSLQSLKAMAGSVVVPDFEITFTEKSLFSRYVNNWFKYVEESEFPANTISRSFLVEKYGFNASITALAPRYDPPIPITTNTSLLLLIFSAALLIRANSSLS